MTPQERAEKISRLVESSFPPRDVPLIAAEMEAYASERVEEVRGDIESKAGFDCAKHCDEAVNEEAQKRMDWNVIIEGLEAKVKSLEADCNERVRKAVEEAEIERAAKQAIIHGESVMLDGRLISNEEMYKQPTDYIKEAKAEAYEDAAKMIQAQIIWTPDGIQRLIDQIRARAAEQCPHGGHLEDCK